MPQGWNNTHWSLAADDPETVERRNTLIHTIGNLTLVTGPLNRMQSNAPRDTKTTALVERGVLLLNKPLFHSGPEVRDKDTIKIRARRLHGQVIEIWPDQEAVIGPERRVERTRMAFSLPSGDRHRPARSGDRTIPSACGAGYRG